MEYYLYQKDIFLPLGGIENNLTAMKDEEWDVLNRKAQGMIRLSLPTSMDFNISKEKTMKELMVHWLNYMKNPRRPIRYF
jgi:hypothetical protein